MVRNAFFYSNDFGHVCQMIYRIFSFRSTFFLNAKLPTNPWLSRPTSTGSSFAALRLPRWPTWRSSSPRSCWTRPTTTKTLKSSATRRPSSRTTPSNSSTSPGGGQKTRPSNYSTCPRAITKISLNLFSSNRRLDWICAGQKGVLSAVQNLKCRNVRL